MATAAAVAEVAHQADQYRNGANGTQAHTDQVAREATANAAHTAVTNSQLATSLNHTTHTIGGVAGVPTYSGGNIVDSVDPTVNTTEVRDAMDAHALFTTGGMISPDDFETLSAYVDPAWLMEASKQTGEKLF